jgi:hypothetical protein
MTKIISVLTCHGSLSWKEGGLMGSVLALSWQRYLDDGGREIGKRQNITLAHGIFACVLWPPTFLLGFALPGTFNLRLQTWES